MDTSKLNSSENIICGIDMFSGRENPEWGADNSFAGKIQSMFDNLPELPAADLKDSPVLGYRGAFIKGGDLEIYAAKYKVTLYQKGKPVLTKSDTSGEIEKAIVYSAPDTLKLPRDIIKPGLE